jgi:hypothetical protein
LGIRVLRYHFGDLPLRNILESSDKIAYCRPAIFGFGFEHLRQDKRERGLALAKRLVEV